MPLAFSRGMTLRALSLTGWVIILSILSAPVSGANAPVSVDVERNSDKAYVVEAAFDVNVPASLAWEVLTDYEGSADSFLRFAKARSKQREAGRRAARTARRRPRVDLSLPMHVVLDVREKDQRVLAFRDVCGKSFATYEGTWELTTIERRDARDIPAESTPERPTARDARAACHQGQRQETLDEVRHEILARAAR